MLIPKSATAGDDCPAAATSRECAALERLAAEIEGRVAFTRPPLQDQGEQKWMVDILRIGEWRAETLDEGICARWSPDGRQLAVFRTPSGKPEDGVTGSVWLVAADGSFEKHLCEGAYSDGARGACPIDFHPDNRHVLFITSRNRVASVDVRSKRVADLGLPGRFENEIQVSGDGQSLVGRWKGRGDWAMNRRMVLVDLAPKLVRVIGAGCCPAVSPDGSWMTVNHDGHFRMSICYRDLERRVSLLSRGIVHPQHGWHDWHWSNHNDYLALKSEVYAIRKYKGQPDGFILKFSSRCATRFTFDREAGFPDLFVSRDKARGRRIGSSGGATIGPDEVECEKYDVGSVFRSNGETVPDPGPCVHTPRLVVEARLESKTPLGARPCPGYRDCLVEYAYTVTGVRKGQIDRGKIILSHWVMRNGRHVTYTQKLFEGRTYRFRLEPWHLHPELKEMARRRAEIRNDDLLPRYFDAGLEERLAGK